MKEIEKIKQRNKRVETDKAWENSKTRKIIIAMTTYILVVIFLYVIDAPKPWLNAIIPAIGFFLSTLTMPIFKRIWIKKIYNK